MLIGKFGEENLPLVNMAWFWARIHARTPRLGTFKGGFQAFTDKLADVVQAYSGGIYLETIFVDEGFGSLDQESLDLALRALLDLQQGGRMVGIISHVPELKEQIDVRLEVVPDRKGSVARFVVNRRQ